MWPNARISVMGGEQAAGVLATVQARRHRDQGRRMVSAQDEEAFKAPIRAQYETPGPPVLRHARGCGTTACVDPAQTRRVLGLSLSAALNAPIPPTKFGIFRM